MKNLTINFKQLNIFLLVIAILLFASNIFINDRAVTLGAELTKTYSDIDDHHRYNQFLSLELSKLTSNDEIYRRASESSYVKADIDFIATSPLAYR